MKTHSTNYINTFIEVAEDSTCEVGMMPPQKGDKKTVANHQFEKLYENPYCYTSDELLFDIVAVRKGFCEGDLDGEREHFFSKGQPCLRTSPLAKSYGWGIHFDEQSKVAIYCCNSTEYRALSVDKSMKTIKAIRFRKEK